MKTEIIFNGSLMQITSDVGSFTFSAKDTPIYVTPDGGRVKVTAGDEDWISVPPNEGETPDELLNRINNAIMELLYV